MKGQLFTQYFLTDGIRTTPEWAAAAGQLAGFRGGLGDLYRRFAGRHQPNEAVTEQDLIRPLLELLGWADYLPQQGAAGGEDVPDHLLFADAAAKARAAARTDSGDRYQDALVVQESKRFGLALDHRDRSAGLHGGTPHGQMLRYLTTAEIASEGRVRWGILTNGGVWRLYDARARPRAGAFLEVDLAELLRPGGADEDGLRVFRLLFGRASFTRQGEATATFLEAAIAEGKRYEEAVAEDLSAVVFERVFPRLLTAIHRAAGGGAAGAAGGGASLGEVRAAALIFLYRLLFLLYAEDRGLLPVNDARYDDYGLRRRVRDDVARRMAAGDTFSAAASHYYHHLTELFRQLDHGDESIGLPPYNGGLFAPGAAPLLQRIRLPDRVVADLIYDLSHTAARPETSEDDAEARRFVNYRDLSVQQLGSIYERLLEREPAAAADGGITVRLDSYARKDSGSFYTPQDLVDLLVDQTLKPLAEERTLAFAAQARELAGDRRPLAERLAALARCDPAAAVLRLKVLDPAMGSGHFLVSAVDFLADYVAEAIERAPAAAAWLEGAYESPLVRRIARIRAGILRRAQEGNWIIDAAQLTDQAIIRRLVLKRCIYGVDKNPLTVELAKVSLWLHSFTAGAPLSFLDHHLRCGDALVGLRVRDAIRELDRLGGLFAGSAMAGAEVAAEGMERIEEMADADVTEVHESAAVFRGVEETTADLRGLLDCLCGLQWLTAGMRAAARKKFELPLVQTLNQQPTDAYRMLARGPESAAGGAGAALRERYQAARAIARRERFLHWEAAFPGVWRRWQERLPEGGFDAVIGNPPWDRIKLQEVEWFATRAPQIARAPTAAARRAAIRALREQGGPLAADFDAAKERADQLGRVVRGGGRYPLLGGGDVNLYSLFVERAMSLVKPDGLVGLLTPSGIYADKTASRFFQRLSGEGRIGGLYDFENRRPGTGLAPFFPDVDSRFKFCALIFGGEERRFDHTWCAFFLRDTRSVEDRQRCFPLAPDDFARVNPNTGTAPVFRTRRDADLTRRIYERHPVLVDRSGPEESRAWPVRYHRMFDMTNDSGRFRTAAQLDAAGFYRVAGNRYQKGAEVCLPLYEGKMVQAFDHRAAGIVVNPANLNRPAQPQEATPDQHADPNWLPAPQFYVSADACRWEWPLEWVVGFKEITAATNYRTVIASVLPKAAFGNKTPIFLPMAGARAEMTDAYKKSAPLLAANLNAMAFDFIARQKIHGQTLNLYIVEQLPVIAPADYDRRFGAQAARELVRDHVLRLTYTAHDLAPFARDLGHAGPPFPWSQEKRRHLRARLDALYFHLYGLSREDAAYVLDTFPIVRRQDESACGRYRTRDLILAYMNALSAGDTKVTVAD